MTLEAPKRIAGTRETRLDLVSDEQPASPADSFDGLDQKTTRVGEDTITGEYGVCHQRSRTDAVTQHVRDCRFNRLGERVADRA